jgi:hypothetical protein
VDLRKSKEFAPRLELVFLQMMAQKKARSDIGFYKSKFTINPIPEMRKYE